MTRVMSPPSNMACLPLLLATPRTLLLTPTRARRVRALQRRPRPWVPSASTGRRRSRTAQSASRERTARVLRSLRPVESLIICGRDLCDQKAASSSSLKLQSRERLGGGECGVHIVSLSDCKVVRLKSPLSFCPLCSRSGRRALSTL